MRKTIKSRLRRLVDERRKARRYKVARKINLLVGMVVETGTAQEPITGRTRDISASGISMSLPLGIPNQLDIVGIGATIRILLALPTQNISMYAEVVRSGPLDTTDVERGQFIAARITKMSQSDGLVYKEYLRTLG